MKPKSLQEQRQDAIRKALTYKTLEEKKKVLAEIRIVIREWNGELNAAIKLLDAEQAKHILEFIAFLPLRGPKKNGG
jgi:hypothetical protein